MGIIVHKKNNGKKIGKVLKIYRSKEIEDLNAT